VSWGVLYGFDPVNTNNANDDPDNDGKTNLEEFIAGTNPNENAANASTIVFVKSQNGGSNDQIYRMSLDGANQTRLTSGVAAFDPELSPNGNKIVFLSSTFDEGNRDIYVMDLDGSNLINLTNTPEEDEEFPVWSPDGTKIYFFDSESLYRVDAADGANPYFVSGVPRIPIFSPDGTRFLTVFSGNNNDTEVGAAYTDVDSDGCGGDGCGFNILAANPADDVPSSWSADGTKILFASDRDGNLEIYSLLLPEQGNWNDACCPVRLTNNTTQDYRAKWSPDGNKIAYWSWDVLADNPEVYSMNADGSNQINLSNYSGFDSEPYWSRDGSKIIFYSTYQPEGGDFYAEIHTVNPDGSNFTNLTNDPNAVDYLNNR